ncbi:Inherit from NOG: Methyltransferase FkbM [Seminavis robusta]|uniref:Inherit from NOG: Methyltransferase FkbM n=1 Tax=Seminavis robusta TaxID=568900 RepID=A0A9N8HAX8_9STRA|nr:Inherit from NOG: Methyltransferase FkbM [Seminavis robusta]|eukprot:Sro338_g120840.1 Inherit from NOG: Methyltransferase FkbM (290) ;mRNA; f:39076-39945
MSLLRSVSDYYSSRDQRVMQVVETPPSTSSQEEQPLVPSRNNDGWHSIDVFYGNVSHLDARSPPPAFHGRTPAAIQEWYGQAQQDRIVYELLNKKKRGYFLDLAANDARTYSNTFALERHHNWTGLCFEPNPQYWHDLSYRSCQVVAAVVGRHRMEEVKFRFQTGVLGGIVDDRFDVKTTNDEKLYPNEPPTLKYTVPLLEILQRYKAPRIIDYLSLDVEGAEEYIMEIFPLEDYQVHVMTIERPSERLQTFLKQHGFGMVQKITRWGETLWAHESFLRAQRQQEQKRQ